MADNYLPEPGDKFNAIVRRYHKVAIGCPCICGYTDAGFVFGVDRDGFYRDFFKRDFIFERVTDDKAKTKTSNNS